MRPWSSSDRSVGSTRWGLPGDSGANFTSRLAIFIRLRFHREPKSSSTTGSTSGRAASPTTPTYSSRPSMNSSASASSSYSSRIFFTRRASPSMSFSTPSPRDASERAGFTTSGKDRSPLVWNDSPSKVAKRGVSTPWNWSSCLVSTLSCASSSPAVPEPVKGMRASSSTAATLTSRR
ncbi:hypothetical protein COSO111634_36575 [Corallococcus soli]